MAAPLYLVADWLTLNTSCSMSIGTKSKTTIQGFPALCPISLWLDTEVKPIETPTGAMAMSKHEVIDCIIEINKTAKPEFLDQFSAEDLDLYLEHLMEVDLEEVCLCA
jgi:hypothetical protein